MSNIFTTVWADIESVFETVKTPFEEFVGFAAGGGSAYALIQEVNPSNKAGTATDILTIASAAYTVMAGTTPPTVAQIDKIFQSFKSNTATTAFDSIASTLATSLYLFIQKYADTSWVDVAKAYVYGLQIAATALGATKPAAATTPATT